MTPVRLEPAALRSRVKHSTTEPLRSHRDDAVDAFEKFVCLLYVIEKTGVKGTDNARHILLCESKT